MKKIIVINAVALVLIAVGCFFFMKDAQSKDDQYDLTKISSRNLYRSIDYEAGVVCYIQESTGIFCALEQIILHQLLKNEF